MKNIILTGASDGLGKEFALRCFMKWFDLNNLPDKLTITTKKAIADYKKLIENKW